MNPLLVMLMLPLQNRLAFITHAIQPNNLGSRYSAATVLQRVAIFERNPLPHSSWLLPVFGQIKSGCAILAFPRPRKGLKEPKARSQI